MTNKLFSHLGIMQGRLLPKYRGRYQAHPLGYWQDEFYIAADLGLNYIEFILDYNDVELNPLLSAAGIKEIQDITQETGVKVFTVCADYFMEAPLHSENKLVAETSLKIMMHLIKNASLLGISDIVLPCVDQSSLSAAGAEERLIQMLLKLEPHYTENKINISLETDLNPIAFGKLLEQIPSQYITVNYDSGNSAALGYLVEEEFAIYANRISDIHIKDRVLGGGSVMLGTGNTNFDNFFREIEKLNYEGPVILQVFRDEEGIEVFKEQLQWLKNKTNQYQA